MTLDEVHRLHRIAIEAGLRDCRDLLLKGYPEGLVAQLPGQRRPNDQLLSDLHELARLTVGEGEPAAPWVLNAWHISGHEVFAEILTTWGLTVPLRVGPAPLAHFFTRARRPRQLTPAQHLIARHALVDFTGREAVLAELDRWADDEAPVAVRLIHGPGGAGKTRLGLEWVRRRAEAGEVAGLLGSLSDEATAALLATERADVVLDYAETRPGLAELLRALARRWQADEPGRLRVLLLARGDGDWWTVLKQDPDVAALLADSPDALPLAELVPPEARVAEFHRAAACFRRHRPGWKGLPTPPDLGGQRFGRALYLHMAAFAAGEGLTITAESLLDDLLDHEARAWLKRAGYESQESSDPARTFRRRMDAAVAALTLRGGAEDIDHLRRLLAALDTEPSDIERLPDLYPGDKGLLVAPLEPDLLGEALVLRLLRDTRWHPAWLDRAVEGAGTGELQSAFAVLGRAEAHDTELACRAVEQLLATDLPIRAEAAFSTLLTLTTHTAHARLGQVLAQALEGRGSRVLAAAFRPRLPWETVQLREVALWVMTCLRKHLPDHPHTQARLLDGLGKRLGDLGRREEALEAITEALGILRRLTAARPDAFKPDLASSLIGQGHNLSAQGRREEALEVTTEAVGIYRRLATAGPDAFEDKLALSLTGLGNRLFALGRREGALQATTEALGIYRRLAAARPGAFEPELALCLTNLGNFLFDLNRREEALEATIEALDIYRRLAAALPDAFAPKLALSLSNLGYWLFALGRREEALEATSEAVDIRRRLAAVRPEAFEPDLAASLSTWSAALVLNGRGEEAVAAAYEGVEIRRRLVRSAAESSDLARSLTQLGAWLFHLKRIKEGLDVCTEAVALQEGLAAIRPETFLPAMAQTLGHQAVGLASLGRLEEALGASARAVAVARMLAAAQPEAHLVLLAQTMVFHANALGEAKHWAESLVVAQEVLDLLWPAFLRQPGAFGHMVGPVIEHCIEQQGDAASPELLERQRLFVELNQ
jgi:tetratricopeptide (TPR) repeat protein